MLEPLPTTLTVYTPTYNRTKTLPVLYKSLIQQKNKGFIWLIIDDGSTDNSVEMIDVWKKENLIPIKYVFQRNGGMLAAHNTAHKLIDTALAVCIDSDDSLGIDAVDIIYKSWSKFKDDESVGGFVGLDSFTNGNIIGSKFVASQLKVKFRDVKEVGGDKKYVYRSKLLKKYGPYPTIAGEKFPAQDYLYRKIDKDHWLVTINEVLCIVEYQEGGNSSNKISSYIKNPKGFVLYRILMMGSNNSLKIKFRNAIHYVAGCILINKYTKIVFNKYFYLTIPAILPGILLYFFLIFKKEGSVNKKLNIPNNH
ncbi:MAG: glycosyltransferase family 2 protein [Aequorivita sp.]